MTSDTQGHLITKRIALQGIKPWTTQTYTMHSKPLSYKNPYHCNSNYATKTWFPPIAPCQPYIPTIWQSYSSTAWDPKFTDTPNTLKGQGPLPALLSKFDGEHSKGMAFLYSFQMYIHLCPNSFSNNQAKITWALLYMKLGRATKLATWVFRWEEQEENRGACRFIDWEDFKDEFWK